MYISGSYYVNAEAPTISNSDVATPSGTEDEGVLPAYGHSTSVDQHSWYYTAFLKILHEIVVFWYIKCLTRCFLFHLKS